MRVLPINNVYSYSAVAARKQKENPTTVEKPEQQNVSFKAGEIHNYKQCFERAFTYDVREAVDFRVVFDKLTGWLRDTAKVCPSEFSSNFFAALYNIKYGKLLERIKGRAILAREQGTNKVLAYGAPELETITFLPPGNNFNPQLDYQFLQCPFVEFSRENLDNDVIFTRITPYGEQSLIEYTKIWGSTGKTKEIFRGYGGHVQENIYYNKDGSENTLKTFFLGMR